MNGKTRLTALAAMLACACMTIAPIASVFAGESQDENSVAKLLSNTAWLASSNSYGSTCLMIKSGDKVIYLDPVSLVSIESLPKADLILITHGHGDHFNKGTIKQLAKEKTKIVLTIGVTASLKSYDTTTLSPGEKTEWAGIGIEAVPAYNDSHPKVALGLGFVLSIDGVRIYFTGDTGLTEEMKALSKIDVVVANLRVPYSLSGNDSASLAAALKPEVLIPIHWIPESSSFGDDKEIESLSKNIPKANKLLILEQK